MPSRRPDPETGLIPVEAEPPMHTIDDMNLAFVDPTPAAPMRRGARERLEQLAMSYGAAPGRIMATEPMRTEVMVDRDLMRQMVNLHIRQMNMNTGEQQVQTLPLDERAAMRLSEQLSEFNPQTRRMQNMQRDYDEARNELRSVSNQLEEVRNHNNTLSNMNDELLRQVRWLERELRDAARERREQAS